MQLYLHAKGRCVKSETKSGNMKKLRKVIYMTETFKLTDKIYTRKKPTKIS